MRGWFGVTARTDYVRSTGMYGADEATFNVTPPQSESPRAPGNLAWEVRLLLAHRVICRGGFDCSSMGWGRLR